MKKYIVEISETAGKDLENIISYLRYSLAGDIIADKYKLLFKQELKSLENIAGSMPVLSEKITGHKNIRKINVRNYILFYKVDEEKAREVVDILAKESKEKNKAIIMVTHDTRLIDKCDKVFMMEDGVFQEKTE